jgi:hypothetical protein
MDSTYSRDECITAVRDYYEFLAEMFMDRSLIIEPPQGGWPDITRESMQGTRKTEEVIQLLRHLPYIVNKPFSHALPGCRPFDWATAGTRLTSGKDQAEAALIMSEGVEEQFGGRIPKYYIGLMHAKRDRDIILLNTRDGLIHWMICPDKIKETSFPKPSFWSSSLSDAPEENEDMHEEERITFEDGEPQASEHEGDNGLARHETPPTSPDDNDDDDQSSDGSDGITHPDTDDDDSTAESDDPDEITWGPSWPIRDFFEMLKNHCRCLNFIPRNSKYLIDIWTNSIREDDPFPDGLLESLQDIYRKHGWPDLNNYQKEECLAEVKRELDEKYPNHYRYYD